MNHFFSPSKKNFARTRMGSSGMAEVAGGALGARTSGMEGADLFNAAPRARQAARGLRPISPTWFAEFHDLLVSSLHAFAFAHSLPILPPHAIHSPSAQSLHPPRGDPHPRRPLLDGAARGALGHPRR